MPVRAVQDMAQWMSPTLIIHLQSIHLHSIPVSSTHLHSIHTGMLNKNLKTLCIKKAHGFGNDDWINIVMFLVKKRTG